MRALSLLEPGALRTITVDDAPAPAAGEARVRVRRVGVCGTDLHAFEGRQLFFACPRILGHELGVEVLAVGEGVTRVAAGDRCAVEPYLNCGHCIACRRGKPNCCTKLQVLGVHVDGGLRERIVLPAVKLHASRVLRFDQLALVETLGIGAHAVTRAALDPGETVAVLGTGPIGRAVIPAAHVVPSAGGVGRSAGLHRTPARRPPAGPGPRRDDAGPAGHRCDRPRRCINSLNSVSRFVRRV